MSWLSSIECVIGQHGQQSGSIVGVCFTHAHIHDVQQICPHVSWIGLTNTPEQSVHETSLRLMGELGGMM